MATTYTYEIDRILTAPLLDGLVDVITEIDYIYKGVDGTGEDRVTVQIRSTVHLEAPDPSVFIAYNNLTEANVREFVKSLADIERNKSLIQGMIDIKRNPKNVAKPLPWS